MSNEINALGTLSPDALPYALRGTLACMGGGCRVRDACALYRNTLAPHVVERACMGWFVVSFAQAHVTRKPVRQAEARRASPPPGGIDPPDGGEKKTGSFLPGRTSIFRPYPATIFAED
jgi:hypothetical protein